MTEPISVPYDQLCSVRFDGVDLQWVDVTFRHANPLLVLRVRYEDGVAVAECLTHEIADELLWHQYIQGVDAKLCLEDGRTVGWHTDYVPPEDAPEAEEDDADPYDSYEEDERAGMCMTCRRDYLDHRGRCEYCDDMMRAMSRCTSNRAWY